MIGEDTRLYGSKTLFTPGGLSTLVKDAWMSLNVKPELLLVLHYT